MNTLYLEICLSYIDDAIEHASGRELATLMWQRREIARRLETMR